jgi:hypothetical protein
MAGVSAARGTVLGPCIDGRLDAVGGKMVVEPPGVSRAWPRHLAALPPASANVGRGANARVMRHWDLSLSKAMAGMKNSLLSKDLGTSTNLRGRTCEQGCCPGKQFHAKGAPQICLDKESLRQKVTDSERGWLQSGY